MTADISPQDQLDELAEAFADELRRGGSPSIEEYVQRCPELADEIRDILATVAMVVRVEAEATCDPNVAAVVHPSATPPFAELGEYRILRELGRGGMGIVYEAEQKSLGRRVALKMLPARSVSGPNQLERFRREAMAAARLHHPHIVPVHSVGEHEGSHYYAMQLIHGHGLDQIIAELRKLEAGEGELRADGSGAAVTEDGEDGSTDRDQAVLQADESGKNDSTSSFAELAASSSNQAPRRSAYYAKVAKLGIEAAEALDYAHREGVVHRDIKPSNLLLDMGGRVWVSDFGLAKDTTGEDLTNTGDLVGTLRFMAPERFRGWADPRSDIYSLGLTLYELITLRPAFESHDRVLLVKRIAHDQPLAPGHIDQNLPRDLETVLLKAMAKEPVKRYQTAAELAADLRRFAAGKPVLARRTSWREQILLWSRRNPGTAALLACVAVLALLLMGGSTAAAVLLARANKRTLDHLEQEVKAKDAVTQSEELALHTLYEARKQQARAGRFSGRPGQRVESVQAVQSAAALIPRLNLPRSERLLLRNEAIAAMQLVDLVDDKLWPTPQVSPVTDRDVRRYVYRENNGGALRVHDMRDGKLLARLTIKGAGHVQRVNFSPDGRYVACRVRRPDRSDQLQVWNVEHPEPILVTGSLFASRAPGTYRYDFSPDGNSVAFLTSDRIRKILRLPDGKPLLNKQVRTVEGLRFAPRSNRLLTFGSGKISMIDLDTGDVARAFEGMPGLLRVDWSPDERLLAGTVRDGYPGDKDLHLWDVVTGEHRVISGHTSNVVNFDFHPRGDVVATGGWDGTTRIWCLADGRQLLQLDGAMTNFSRDGRWLGHTQLGRVGRWRVELPSEFLTRAPVAIAKQAGGHPLSGDFHVAVHPEGRLMTSGHAYQLHVWDLASYEPLAGASRPGSFSQFSPDGRRLFTAHRLGEEVYVQFVNKQETDTELIYTIGPPRRLQVARTRDSDNHDQATGPFGTRGYQGEIGELYVYDMNNLRLIRVKAKHRGQNLTAVTRDGRLLAAAHWHGPDTHVWDVQSGDLIKTIPSHSAYVGFSPSGQMLAVAEPGRCSFYDTQAWRLLHETAPAPVGNIPRPVTFSPDGSMVAFNTENRREGKILSTRDFTELATVYVSENDLMRSLDFSNDGSCLFERATSTGSLHIWDLRKIHQSLGELVWDCPPFPEAKYDPSKPMRVRLIQCDDWPAGESSEERDGQPDIRIVPSGGVFDGPQDVRIESDTVDAKIQYTLDYGIPSLTPSTYEKPLSVSSSATLIAWDDSQDASICQAVRANFFFHPDALPLGDDSWKVRDAAEEVSEGPSRWSVHQNGVWQSSNIYAGTDHRSKVPQGHRDGTLRIYQEASDFSDGELVLDVRSDDDDRIGVAFRLQDDRHHYRFVMDRERGYHILARVDGDDYEVLDHNDRGYWWRQWYQVRVVMDGEKLSVFIDGQKDLEATDDTFSHGTIALYSSGNDDSRFRNIRLTPARPSGSELATLEDDDEDEDEVK